MKGLGAEIAKNLVLSGINSLTLLDSNDVSFINLIKFFPIKMYISILFLIKVIEEDLKNNFLLAHASIGKNVIIKYFLFKKEQFYLT
jgi:hypothetical protein